MISKVFLIYLSSIQMGAVNSTGWGTEGGQNLVHVLRKLARGNR